MQRLSGLSRKIYEWFWLRIPIARAGLVTTISDETLRETFSYVSADRDKFHVIPCCLTGDLIQHHKEINTVKPRLLHVGSKANKNLPRVIEAVAGLSCCLVIIGILSAEQLQLLNSKGIYYENYVGLDDAAMAQQYQLADLVVFVSTYEGFGLPILEAQAVGRAVVTSARAPMDDVAGSGAALVDPESVESIRASVEKVIKDTEYRNKLIRAGFENVKRYSPQAIAAQYAAVYEELYQQRLS
jgi:glycosyltransferase involved in cell wall biosynthesis